MFKADNTYTLFLVDDDQPILNLLTATLGKNPNLRIQTFTSGELCVEKLRNFTPDVIVLDYDFGPGKLNGLETLHKIQEINPHIPVIMLSVQDRIDVTIELLKNRVFDYVIKNETAVIHIQHIINYILEDIYLRRKNNRSRKIGYFLFAIVLLAAVLIINHQSRISGYKVRISLIRNNLSELLGKRAFNGEFLGNLQKSRLTLNNIVSEFASDTLDYVEIFRIQRGQVIEMLDALTVLSGKRDPYKQHTDKIKLFFRTYDAYSQSLLPSPQDHEKLIKTDAAYQKIVAECQTLDILINEQVRKTKERYVISKMREDIFASSVLLSAFVIVFSTLAIIVLVYIYYKPKRYSLFG